MNSIFLLFLSLYINQHRQHHQNAHVYRCDDNATKLTQYQSGAIFSCLAITHFNSYRWYHHVDSKNGRNLAINVWIHHLSKFNASDCNATPTDESRFVSVAKFMQDNKKIDLRSEKIAQTHELGISLLYNMTNYFTSGVPFFQRFSTWRARG